MMKFLLIGTIIATLATLQGCGIWAINHYPELVAPADPASLNFDQIDHATETSAAVTIIDLRRVERGVHIVFAIERPALFDQRYHGFMLAFDLENLPPTAIELLDTKGNPVPLRPRDREVIQLPFSGNHIRWQDPFLVPIAGRERLCFYETRFRTARTLPEGTYRVRAIPSEFPKSHGLPMNINADQKTFTPALVPPLPDSD